MKKFAILCSLLFGFIMVEAQNVIDNFSVGPYVVDYISKGNVKYRLRDNIDLYEFFELQRDTVIAESDNDLLCNVPGQSVNHAVQVALIGGTTFNDPKEIGVQCLWMQKVAHKLYFNAGLSFIGGITSVEKYKRNMLEIGVPLQLELGNLMSQRPSFYGLIGVMHAFYSTASAKVFENGSFVDAGKDYKKSGLLMVPSLEFGGNLPAGNLLMRIGVYISYKMNCTPGNYDVYKHGAGRAFIGGRIGIVI